MAAISDIRGDGFTLNRLIQKLVTHLGSDVSVVNDSTPEPFNKAEDVAVPEVGENAFSFVETYAKKRQAILSSNADGDIEITQSKGTQTGITLQNSIAEGTNNILAASDRKSTRLNSSHRCISYPVFCLKKKKQFMNILRGRNHEFNKLSPKAFQEHIEI